MNATGHFEEDDLALYAMHLLAEPEASAVARYVSESAEARRMLAEVQARLGTYAEASVELEAAPEGSLGRLMGRIERERKVTVMPEARPETADVPASRGGRVLPWIGWAIAAVMAIAAGKLYKDRTDLHQTLSAQSGAAAQTSASAADATRERDALEAKLAEETRRLEALQAEATGAKSEAADLRAATAAQSAKLSQETARATEQTQAAANAARERDTLQATITAQANQVAQLTSERARAEKVLEALNDRTALRVTLTQPKSAAAPTGRATYVASRGTLVFLASNLAPLEANKVYELWLLPADGSSPVPAGTFVPDARGNATIVNAQLAGAVAAKGFAVTKENEGGALTPTMPLLLAGL